MDTLRNFIFQHLEFSTFREKIYLFSYLPLMKPSFLKYFIFPVFFLLVFQGEGRGEVFSGFGKEVGEETAACVKEHSNEDLFLLIKNADNDAARIRYSHAWNHLDLAESYSKLDPTVLTKLGDDLLDSDFATYLEGGVGRVKAWEGLINIPAFGTNIPWLTRANSWIEEGGEFVTTNGLTKLRKNGEDILELKNEKILPNKKSDYHQGTDGTPIGTPANGYQVVKVGDDIKVKRVPDESPYVNTTYHTKLTEHPNAHVLQRHGHDVTDDALIKRANEGIAPDGSTINPNPPYTKPPYSSKFDNSDAVKSAYDNTMPGSAAFNSTPLVNGTKTVYHTLTSGSYGKGVPKDGNTFQTATKVRAVYQDMGNGNFQLLTMFPDF